MRIFKKFIIKCRRPVNYNCLTIIQFDVFKGFKGCCNAEFTILNLGIDLFISWDGKE